MRDRALALASLLILALIYTAGWYACSHALTTSPAHPTRWVPRQAPAAQTDR